MDRSLFNFVGSTNDLEKRQAYKEKLANKIDTPQPKELLSSDNTFNGVSPGGTLVHPSLGEGILVEVDHDKNEVLIDFGTNGLIGLVLSQAKSFVHSPVKKEERGIAGGDAFSGGEIQSRMLAPQDRDFREVDFSKITSSDFIEPKKSFFAEGSNVWHPDLGVCIILSVDEKSNSLTLAKTPNLEVIDMVLSQVRSKLRVVETTPEHVPMKPLVREKLAPPVPQYKSRGGVFVKLPEAFKLWQRNQQFLFLTNNQHLTTEQANDVFAILDGNKPLFHMVTVDWQTKEETESSVTPGPITFATVAESKTVPGILLEKILWHPDFGECSVASVDMKNNQLVLLTSIGQVPCVLDVTVPTLAPIKANSGIEHAHKELRVSRVLATSDTPVENRPQIDVDIPEVFVNWREIDQLQFLTVSKHLTMDQAKDIVAAIAGKLHSSKTEYVIHWTDEVAEPVKRAEFKTQLSQRVEAASVEPELPAPPAPVDPGIRRFTEDKVITKTTPVVKKVSVDLSTDFRSWSISGQRLFLTNTKHLTPNEADDVLSVLQGKSFNGQTEYEINWTDPISRGSVEADVRRVVENEDVVVRKESILKKVEVKLPADFTKWDSGGQYVFLTRTRQLTSNEANDVVDFLHGKPINSKIQYEIVWSE